MTGPASQIARISPRWRPVPAVQLSVLAHAAGAATLAADPALWTWAAGTIAANHLLLSGAVLFPRSRVLGPNCIRLPEGAVDRGEVSLTFDDGPDPEVTPRVLDLLDARQAKASFFCVGERISAYPRIVTEIARRGHSVENHSYRHSHWFSFYGLSRLRREVERTQEVIMNVTGQPPQFFRAPAGFRSVLLDPVLARSSLRYVSWTRRAYDTVSRVPERALTRLINGLSAGDILLLHNGPAGGTRRPVVLDILPRLLDEFSRRDLRSVSLPEAFRVA